MAKQRPQKPAAVNVVPLPEPEFREPLPHPKTMLLGGAINEALARVGTRWALALQHRLAGEGITLLIRDGKVLATPKDKVTPEILRDLGLAKQFLLAIEEVKNRATKVLQPSANGGTVNTTSQGL